MQTSNSDPHARLDAGFPSAVRGWPPLEPNRSDPDFVPLAERLKAYAATVRYGGEAPDPPPPAGGER
jgi:hypothetical protein